MKNKKDILVMLKEAAILFVITLLAGLFLGFVYEVTKEPRAYQAQKAIEEACIAVFPDAKANGVSLVFNEITVDDTILTDAEFDANSVEIGTVYEATNGGEFYGYVVEAVSKKGYGGKIVLYVGVDKEKKVCGVSITEISETAGLGMEAPNVLVPQFANKTVEKFSFTKTGATKENEVDAISSATITTRAVTNAVNGGLKVANRLLEGGAE